LPEEALPWVAEARDVFDEMIIFIDEKRTTPETIARAQTVADRIIFNKADTWYSADRISLISACTGDWIFGMDYDEQLSPVWQQGGWRRLLETTDLNHFWIPRRWTVSLEQYINSNPWWPDFQLRLFRNNLAGTMFPSKLHETAHVPGVGASLQNLALYHHVLWLLSREEREAKAAYYEQLRPGFGSGHYYLYEDYRPSQAPVPESTKLDVTREIIRMDALPRERIPDISMKVKTAPREVIVSEMFWLDVEITNATSEPLYSCPPFPVRLSYHWMQEATHLMVVFNGERSGRYPCAPANTTTPWRMVVRAPSEPGKYILQTTMVQDGVCWFEDLCPEIVQEFVISVM